MTYLRKLSIRFWNALPFPARWRCTVCGHRLCVSYWSAASGVTEYDCCRCVDGKPCATCEG